MPAYVVSEVTIVDEPGAQSYRAIAAASIAKYHGRYLSRGLKPHAAEGIWPADATLIIVEFPDMATTQRWYASPEYAEALEIRATALDRRLLFIDGTNPG